MSLRFFKESQFSNKEVGYQSQLYFRTISFITQNVLHVSTFYKVVIGHWHKNIRENKYFYNKTLIKKILKSQLTDIHIGLPSILDETELQIQIFHYILKFLCD
jgi:hypothetical protein